MGADTEHFTDDIVIRNSEGTYRASFSLKENGLVLSKVYGYEDFESSQNVVKTLMRLYVDAGVKLRLCLDATEYTGLEPRSRKYMRDALIGKDSFVKKFAVIGGNFFTRNLFNMFSKVANMPMKVFASKESAIEWLMEK